MCLVRSALNLSIKRNASQVQVHVKFILNSPLLFRVKVIVKLKESWSLLRKSIFAFRCPLSALKFSASSNIIMSIFTLNFTFFGFCWRYFSCWPLIGDQSSHRPSRLDCTACSIYTRKRLTIEKQATPVQSTQMVGVGIGFACEALRWRQSLSRFYPRVQRSYKNARK